MFLKGDSVSSKTFLPIVSGPRQTMKSTEPKLEISVNDDPNYEPNYGEGRIIRDPSFGVFEPDYIHSPPTDGEKTNETTSQERKEPVHFLLNDEQFQQLIHQIGPSLEAPELGGSVSQTPQPLFKHKKQHSFSEASENLGSTIVFHSPKKQAVIESTSSIPSLSVDDNNTKKNQ